jgi:hypothetical protein
MRFLNVSEGTLVWQCADAEYNGASASIEPFSLASPIAFCTSCAQIEIDWFSNPHFFPP